MKLKGQGALRNEAKWILFYGKWEGEFSLLCHVYGGKIEDPLANRATSFFLDSLGWQD